MQAEKIFYLFSKMKVRRSERRKERGRETESVKKERSHSTRLETRIKDTACVCECFGAETCKRKASKCSDACASLCPDRDLLTQKRQKRKKENEH